MDLINPAAQEFAEKATTPASPLLERLEKETRAKAASFQMLSGHLQGAVLGLVSRMVQPKAILEIGTFTGYSAICLASGLAKGGQLDTIDLSPEWSGLCQKYFKEAGLEGKIKAHTGNALEIIPGLKGPYDIVFIDADKVNYSRYYDLVFDKVPAGGIILADNLLFHGEVLVEDGRSDAAKALIAFRDKVAADDRVEQVLLTVRDGLLLIRKKDSDPR